MDNEKKLEFANSNVSLTNEEKEKMINEATEYYKKFLDTLKINWRNDPNTRETPYRVTKTFVNDLANGCYNEEPNITSFENTNKYDGIIYSGNISVKSICSHHLLPFFGSAYLAYIPKTNGKIIGLSKFNRIVEHFSRRPQVQENLTQQIHDFLDKKCKGNRGVAVLIEATHTCASLRGVNDDSVMKTTKLSGAFLKQNKVREEFYNFVYGR